MNTLKSTNRTKMEAWCVVLFFCISVSFADALKDPKYQFKNEWNMWKNVHGKSYQSEKEDLENHIVWLSNKEYIDQHNKNADIFGFTLALNHLGDMVKYLAFPPPPPPPFFFKV